MKKLSSFLLGSVLSSSLLSQSTNLLVQDMEPPLSDFCSIHIATLNELKQLKRSTYALKDWNPGVSDEDLAPINKIVGDATIVGLGEGTHGTSEFFKMKHRLIEFLVKNKGFNIFSIEANMPEAYRINEYVLYGKGDPKVLIKGMYFWTWQTPEVLDLVQWMREYNKTAKNKVQFTGFDMQFDELAFKIVLRDLEKVGFDQEVKLVKQWIPEFSRWSSGSFEERENFTKTDHYQAILQQIIVMEEKIIAGQASLEQNLGTFEYQWLKQNLLILKQFYTGVTGIDRDKAMADNLLWIKEQNPGAKIIIWAHNGHVDKSLPSMGGYLQSAFGDEYRVVGTTTYEGTYTAKIFHQDVWELRRDNVLSIPPKGTFEANLKKLDKKIVLVDFQSIFAKKQPEFLLQPICWRAAGSQVFEPSFYEKNIGESFDAVIDIDYTTATQDMPH